MSVKRKKSSVHSIAGHQRRSQGHLQREVGQSEKRWIHAEQQRESRTPILR